MSTIPIISVVIPVYNTEQYLKQCLDSVLCQTFSDFEIICVNDKSPDNSKDILEEYKKKDSRVNIIDHQVNQGLGPSRNTGIDIAKGRYIMFIDSDDYISPETLELCLQAIEKENADIIQCMTQRVSDYSILRENPFPKINNYQVISNNLFELLIGENNYWLPVSACAKLFKTKHFKNNKFPNLISEDIVSPYTILLTKAKKVVFLPYIAYFYRKNLSGISRKSSLEHSCKTIEDQFTNYKMLLNLRSCISKQAYQAVCQLCSNLFKAVLKWNLDELDEKTRMIFLLEKLPIILEKVEKYFSNENWNEFLYDLFDYFKYKNIQGFEKISGRFSYKNALTTRRKISIINKIYIKLRNFKKPNKILVLHNRQNEAFKYLKQLFNIKAFKYKIINPDQKNMKGYPLYKYDVIIDCSTFLPISCYSHQKYILVYIPILDHNIKVNHTIQYDAILTLNLISKSHIENNFIINDDNIFNINSKIHITKSDQFLIQQSLGFVKEKIKYLLVVSDARIFAQINLEKVHNLLNDNEVILIHDPKKLSLNNFFSKKIINVSSFNVKNLYTLSEVVVLDNLIQTSDVISLERKALFISNNKAEWYKILSTNTHQISIIDKEKYLIQDIRQTNVARQLKPDAINYINRRKY